MEVCVIKPTSVEDAREITETLLNNRTVVLNVEGLDVEIAQRIIDYRTMNGGFESVDDLLHVEGIGEKKLDAILEFIKVGG